MQVPATAEDVDKLFLKQKEWSRLVAAV